MCSASPLRQSFHAARSQQRTVGPPSIERFSVTESYPVPNSCPFTVARDSCLDSVQPNRSASCAAHHPSAELPRGPKPTEDCWATVMERFSVTKNRPAPNDCPFTVARDSRLDSVQPNRSASCAAHHPFGLSRSPKPTEDCWATVMERFSVTRIVQQNVVHSRWLETPVSIQCSQIVQRHVQRITFGRAFTRPEPTEDCWATVNGTLLGNQESSRTERLSIHGGSRLPSRFSAAKSFSVTCSASSANLSRSPKPTEDCWATVNGTLLGNQESTGTERLSIHGGSNSDNIYVHGSESVASTAWQR